ncbi:MAG: hypothetical protein WD824_23320 [Cyclobacteriaceae bacterium]
MLQNASKPLAIRSLALVAVCATLISFSAKIGGDSFTIYLNDKLMLQQDVTPDAGVRNFSLNVNNGDDVLKIHYSHCGKVGSGRSISIKNDDNKVLKTWNFSSNTSAVMTFKVRDIPAAANAGNQKLFLVYSSKELPEGKLLASVLVSNGNKASLGE